jgi:molybdopterin-guanine dinucleotide biosynthesis protein A
MLTIAIQAGGQSQRMGQDKALMPFLGQPLVQRVLERVNHLGDEVLITTNHPEHFGFLGIPMHPDIIPDRGALGGLYAALNAARYPLVAVIACDMPFVNPDLLAAGRDILLETGVDLVVPSTQQGLEPIHAVYRRKTCLPAIEAALKAGKWRLISWFDQVEVQVLSPEEVSLYDPEGLAFLNVNTPEAFHQAEQIARSLTN